MLISLHFAANFPIIYRKIQFKNRMKTAIANKKIETIIKKVEKDGVQAKGLIDDLKDLRENNAKKEEDPLVTKVLRLMYEYLEENNSFEVEWSI